MHTEDATHPSHDSAAKVSLNEHHCSCHWHDTSRQLHVDARCMQLMWFGTQVLAADVGQILQPQRLLPCTCCGSLSAAGSVEREVHYSIARKLQST